MSEDWFGNWEMKPDELNEILTRNPSLRGMLLGYLAEEKLRKMYWEGAEHIENLMSPDVHNRDLKGDWYFDYKGESIIVEVKSLQSNYVEKIDTLDGETRWEGKFQCDASDSREVTLPNGIKQTTTCLVVGEFDLLAVNLFAFGNNWRFAFAKNEDLPRSRYSRYDEEVREHLITSMIDIEYPFAEDSIFRESPWELLDETIEDRRTGKEVDSVERQKSIEGTD